METNLDYFLLDLRDDLSYFIQNGTSYFEVGTYLRAIRHLLARREG